MKFSQNVIFISTFEYKISQKCKNEVTKKKRVFYNIAHGMILIKEISQKFVLTY